MPTPNMRDVAALCDDLDRYGVPRHPDVDKAVTAYQILQDSLRGPRPLAGRLLDLDPEQLLDRLNETVSRLDTAKTGTAANQMQRQLNAEAAAALVEHVPVILKKLRPVFDKAAKGVHAAATAGLRPGMTADEVLDLGSPEAVVAYRALPQHTATLQQIATIRIRLSEMLGVPPQITEHQYGLGERVDYTACFTLKASGVVTGYSDHKSADRRWLALSLATGGRLRLNDPDETLRMLQGEGDSEGWIVDAGSCVVTDDRGAQLILYREDWIPTWVDQEQLEQLIEKRLLRPAKAGAVRPGDKYPERTNSSWAVAR